MSSAEPVQQVSFPTSVPSLPVASLQINTLPNKSMQPDVYKPPTSVQGQSKATTIGLTSAGLCIIAGSLLLIFVYLVGQGFLSGGTMPTSNTQQQASAAKARQTATATYLSQITPTVITPTPTLPGQGLLDLSVLSNDYNSIQPLTDFKVNQTIYVVLSLHPGGNSHAVCLNWYLNSSLVRPYVFEVDPTTNDHYYSYTTMSTTGSGYVDISLASTKACTDALMAKRLDFTVSAA